MYGSKESKFARLMAYCAGLLIKHLRLTAPDSGQSDIH
jgi:hypothetical protein